MANYEDNAYNWLKRKGLAAKYEFAGIYCIKVDNEIVYIGKSGNMLRRIAQHYAGIQMGTEKKYRIMAEARRKGHNIGFDVLYYGKMGNEISRCKIHLGKHLVNKGGRFKISRHIRKASSFPCRVLLEKSL